MDQQLICELNLALIPETELASRCPSQPDQPRHRAARLPP